MCCPGSGQCMPIAANPALGLGHWVDGRRAERTRAGRNAAAFAVIDENPDDGEDSGNLRSKSKVSDVV